MSVYLHHYTAELFGSLDSWSLELRRRCQIHHRLQDLRHRGNGGAMRWQICQRDGYIEENIMRIEWLQKDLTCTEPAIRRITMALHTPFRGLMLQILYLVNHTSNQGQAQPIYAHFVSHFTNI